MVSGQVLKIYHFPTCLFLLVRNSTVDSSLLNISSTPLDPLSNTRIRNKDGSLVYMLCIYIYIHIYIYIWTIYIWTKNVVMWRNFLILKGVFPLIWDILNVLIMYKDWVWAQSRRSKPSIWVGTFWKSIFKKLLTNNETKVLKICSKINN